MEGHGRVSLWIRNAGYSHRNVPETGTRNEIVITFAAVGSQSDVSTVFGHLYRTLELWPEDCIEVWNATGDQVQLVSEEDRMDRGLYRILDWSTGVVEADEQHEGAWIAHIPVETESPWLPEECIIVMSPALSTAFDSRIPPIDFQFRRFNHVHK
jgi:hypothetical protein